MLINILPIAHAILDSAADYFKGANYLMLDFLAVGMGGFLGASMRYAINFIPFFSFINFPAATLLINFSGAFMIGMITAWSEHFKDAGPISILFLKTGLCGGFTTFSTFSLETMELRGNGRIAAGISYAALSVVLCLLAIYVSRPVFYIIFS